MIEPCPGQLLTGTSPDTLGLQHVLVTHPAVEPGPLGGVAGLGEEEADGVWSNFPVVRIDPNIPSFVFPVFYGDQNQVESEVADLSYFLSISRVMSRGSQE